MEVWVFPGNLLRFIPDKRMDAKNGFNVEFDEFRYPFLIDKAERMDTKSLHHPETSRDGPIGHEPHDHMCRLLVICNKIPERIMGR